MIHLPIACGPTFPDILGPIFLRFVGGVAAMAGAIVLITRGARLAEHHRRSRQQCRPAKRPCPACGCELTPRVGSNATPCCPGCGRVMRYR